MKFFVDEDGVLYKIKFRKDDTDIVIPEGVVDIANGVFYSSKKRNKKNINAITSVRLPSTMKYIGDNCFKNCEGLKEVYISGSIIKIGKSAFQGCANLEIVDLGEGIVSIDDRAFYGCEKLNAFLLPESLISIGKYAFSNCSGLKEMIVPDSVSVIEDGAFYGCNNLESVKLSSLINIINPRVFSDCSNLKNIEIPEGIVSIKEYAFSKCARLSKIRLPESLKEIRRQAFYLCEKLSFISIPENVTIVEPSAFYCCSGLEEVRMSKGITTLDKFVFEGCTSLKKIELPKNLKYIANDAFAKCINLDEIIIPSSVRHIDEEAFIGCTKLKKITFKNFFNLNEKCVRKIFDKNYYYDYDKKELLILKNGLIPDDNFKQINKHIVCNDREYGGLYVSIILSLIFDEERFKKINHVDTDLAKAICTRGLRFDNYEDILENLHCDKEYVHLCKRIQSILPEPTYKSEIKMMLHDLFFLAYSLGAFCEEPIKRQKACEYIYNMIEKEKFSCRTFHSVFDSMSLMPFNQEWANFFMKKGNFEKMLNVDVENSGFIVRVHKNFNKIEEYETSNRGGQRALKVTVEKCVDFFMKSSFDNIDESNEDIAKEIIKYTHSQEAFDDAVAIRKEYLKLRENNLIKDHILGEELKSLFNDISETMSNLNDVANNFFSYEFLSKYDAKNYVLGKYCSCCAHLEGTGYGIMKASILHPDCQNLIIRDEKGRIIAKSTLYVNRKQGYGVFNNVEINNKYIDNEEVLSKIYERYMEAIDNFASRYNEIFSDRPLTKITVGMKLNDLEKKIRKNGKRSSVILQGFDFSKYGNYAGDWREEQYVVWSKHK